MIPQLISTEAEFVDEIQSFLLAIHSPLYSFAMRFLFLQTHATSYSFYSSVAEPDRKSIPPSLWFKKVSTLYRILSDDTSGS
jgi:hypothetical protein